MSSFFRSPFKRHIHNGLKIENKNDEATVYIYDEISWFGVDAGQFIKDLQGIDAKTIHVRLNSPGGSVFDGTAIFNALKQHSAKVVVHVDGLAASITSVIAMAGDEIIMGEGSYLMIHDPFSIMIGTADDFRQEADLLDKVGGTIAGIYQGKTGKDEQEIKDMMAAEIWLTADEAVEMGFADRVDKGTDDKKKAQVKNLFDLSVFAHVPDALKGKSKAAPTEREIERILRDAGLSRKQAKTAIARGFAEDLLDADPPESTPPNDPQRDAETVAPVTTADLLIKAQML